MSKINKISLRNALVSLKKKNIIITNLSAESMVKVCQEIGVVQQKRNWNQIRKYWKRIQNEDKKLKKKNEINGNNRSENPSSLEEISVADILSEFSTSTVMLKKEPLDISESMD